MVWLRIDKDADVFKLANQVGLQNPDVKEEGGKIRISGQTDTSRSESPLGHHQDACRVGKRGRGRH